MKKSNLNNHLIIAMPHLNDTIFNKSVILINDHSNDGTMGLIINKPIKSKDAAKILFNDFNDIAKKIKNNIYFGGPVNLESCFILHDNSYLIDKSLPLSPNLSLTTDTKAIDDIAKGKGPKYYKFNMGYSGWSSGQLEKEIKNGDWLILKNPDNFIFDVPDEKKWSHTLNELGIDSHKDWTTSGGQA